MKKISDPVNNSEMWTLADNASLRFVRDAVRYRRAGTIDLVIQDDGEHRFKHVKHRILGAEMLIAAL